MPGAAIALAVLVLLNVMAIMIGDRDAVIVAVVVILIAALLKLLDRPQK